MDAGLKGRWRRMLMTTVVPMLLLFCFFYAYSSDYTDTLTDVGHSPEGAKGGVDGQISKPQHISLSTPLSVSSVAPSKAHQSVALPAHSSPALRPETAHQSSVQAAATPAAPSHSSTPPAAPEKEEDDDLSMEKVIKALYRPVLHPVDAANFTDEEGKTHKLAGEPRFKEKLGKRVLILDIDSRPLDGEGQLLDPNLKWRGMRPLSAGMLSHYMFAMIHGYDYKFVRSPDYADRWGTWVKVPMMREALKTHDYIVFMDSDVMFHYPHLPLEWLLNYWGMTEETLAMMSVDPDEPQNYDAKGNRFLNTGFVIAQRSNRTLDMYKAWAECPSEARYEGCARWKLDWPHEQSAFGNYLRYDFNRPEDIKVLPCAEANGAPEAINRGGCKGVFVRHFWIDKGLLAKGFADSVMQYFLPRLHQLYMSNAAQNIMDRKGEFRLEGAEMIRLTEKEKEDAVKEGGKNQKDEGFRRKKAQVVEKGRGVETTTTPVMVKSAPATAVKESGAPKVGEKVQDKAAEKKTHDEAAEKKVPAAQKNLESAQEKPHYGQPAQETRQPNEPKTT